MSFEIGVKPFLSNDAGPVALIIFTVLFFTVACLLSLNPTKIIDVIGKFLTPIKLTFIGLLVVTAIIHPIGSFQAPSEGYASHVFLKDSKKVTLLLMPLSLLYLESSL